MRLAIGGLRWVGLAILSIALLAVAGAMVPKPLFPVRADGPDDVGDRRILLLSNLIHSDIALPADPDLLARFSFLANADLPLNHPGLQWIVIGWGGKSFYLETPTWADLKPLPVLRAFTLDSSVMHVALAGEIDPAGPDVLPIILPENRYEALVAAIEASFSRDNVDRPEPIENAGYGPNDRFYEAQGHFNALLGCNTWTASMLRVAGLRTGQWNPLPQSLAWSLRFLNACNDPLGCRLAGE